MYAWSVARATRADKATPAAEQEVSTPEVAEFMLESGKVPVLIVEPMSDSFARIFNGLAARDDVQIIRCKSTLEALPIIRRLEGGLLLLSVRDKNSIVKQVSLLKLLAKLIRRGSLKVLCTSKVKHSGLFSIYHRHGVSELLEEPVHPRSLEMKLERHLSRMGSQFGVEGAVHHSDVNAQAQMGRTRKRRRKDGKIEVRREATWKLGPPIEIESDFWLSRGGSGRHVMGRWIIRVIGPSPSTGRWLQAEGEGEGTNKFWQWMPNNPNDQTFLKEQGAWVFYGHRPDFNEDRWVLVGSAPRLSFYYEGESYAEKIYTQEDGTLIIAKDNQNSAKMIVAIQKTYEKVIRGELAKKAEDPFRLEAEAVESENPQAVEDDAAAAEWNDLANPDEEDEGAEDFVDTKDAPQGDFNDRRGGAEEGTAWNDHEGEEDEEGAEDGGSVARKKKAKLTGMVEAEPEADAAAQAEYEALLDTIGSEDFGETAEEETPKGRRGKPKLRADEPVADEFEDARAGEDAADLPEIEEGGESGTATPGARKPSKELKKREERPEYRIAAANFNDAGGDWDFVKERATGSRWFTFVDPELATGAVAHASSLGQFWLYEGIEKPKLDAAAGEWVFLDREPHQYEIFADLPGPVREYLQALEAGDDDFIVGKEPSAAEPDTDGATYEAGSPDATTEDEGAADVIVDEVIAGPAVQEEEEDDFAHDSPRGFANKLKKRVQNLESGALPDGVVEALDTVGKSIDATGIGAILEASAQKKSGDKSQKSAISGTPGDPGISPMALAFLLSELMSRTGMEPTWVADRFSAYLSTSMGGIRVEVWNRVGRSWERLVGAGDVKWRDEATTAAGEAFRHFSMGTESSAVRLSPTTCAAPIRAGGSIAAVFVFAGRKAGDVPESYLTAIADLSSGFAPAVAALVKTSAAA